MALQVSDIITAARGRHPAFERRNVPDAVLARFLTGYQRSLVSRAFQKNPSFLVQQASIGFDVAAANAVGVAGAGTVGGLPVRVTNGSPAIVSAPVGSAAEVDVDEDATVHYSEKPVTSAAALSLTYSGAAWTTNEHDGRTVVITAGKGAGQRREIASNTGTQLALVTGDEWDVIPDTTSVFKIVGAVIEDADRFGAVAGESLLAERFGYLVRLSATGVAYLDLTRPLVAKYAVGIPLPGHHHVVGGTVRFEDDEEGSELNLIDYGNRLASGLEYAAYVQNGELFLVGTGADWRGVASIDLRYVPVPPAVTALSDYLLLPDSAYQPLADGAAEHAAIRVNGLEGVGRVDVQGMRAARLESEGTWLAEVGQQKRRAISRMRGWS